MQAHKNVPPAQGGDPTPVMYSVDPDEAGHVLPNLSHLPLLGNFSCTLIIQPPKMHVSKIK